MSYWSKRRAERREKGICLSCNNPIYKTGYCRDHHEKFLAYQREYQAKKRANQPPKERKLERFYDKDTGKFDEAAYQRERAQQKREQGICYRCNHQAYRGGYCKECYEHMRSTSKTHREKRKAMGLCRSCTNVIFRQGLCEKHYERQLAHARQWQAKQKAQTD